jgi:hypothetical protein
LLRRPRKEGKAIFILAVSWPTMLDKKGAQPQFCKIPPDKTAPPLGGKAPLISLQFSVSNKHQASFENVKRMVLLPLRNRSTKARWPLSAYSRRSSKPSVDISKLSKCKWHIKYSMLC